MWRSILSRPVITGALTVLLGLALLAPGLWLIALGGSWYYAIAGAGLVIAGLRIAAGRRDGLWLYGLILAGTVLWSVWEVGLDGWRLMPRLFGPALWGLWLCMPWVAGRLIFPGRERAYGSGWGRAWMGAVACLVLGTVVLGLGWMTTGQRYRQLGQVQPAIASTTVPSQPDTDWRYYGRTSAGDRFSPLTQITPKNVADLKLAWTFHSGDLPRKGENTKGREFNLEVTPIKVGDTLYICTPHRQVIALDAVTGVVKWRFDPRPDTHANVYLACRGVAYFDGGPGPECAQRIITTTADARLFALDAATGQLCPGFGQGGYVSLRAQMGPVPPGFHFISSQPHIISGKIVLGGWVYDNQSEDEPSGVVRAYDAITGAAAWSWDLGRRPANGLLGPGETYTRGTPNAWGTYTSDPALNLIYLPLGNATPDYYGGNRRPFDDAYSSSIVALDANTGQERWHFQTVHHDLWDFDLPIGPSLVDLPQSGGGVIPALVQTTKQGQLYLLDRRDGHPLATVQETRVPAGKIPGERYSPTQPLSTGMPSLTPAKLTEKDMWGATPIDQLLCRIQFRKMDYTGLFTPPSERGNIGYPAFDGVVDWYGASVDPERHLLIANSSYIPFTYKLIPHDKAMRKGMIKPWSGWGQPYPQLNFKVSPQYGTPMAAIIQPWLNALGAPCNAPPWGKITAIDLVTRKVVWDRPLGTTKDAKFLGLRVPVGLPTGIFQMGGNVITRGGVIFVGATADPTIRALDAQTGKVLWQAPLPAGGQATPMTYQGRDGRQYVVIAAGGHGGLETRSGDAIVAYALPR